MHVASDCTIVVPTKEALCLVAASQARAIQSPLHCGRGLHRCLGVAAAVTDRLEA